MDAPAWNYKEIVGWVLYDLKLLIWTRSWILDCSLPVLLLSISLALAVCHSEVKDRLFSLLGSPHLKDLQRLMSDCSGLFKPSFR